MPRYQTFAINPPIYLKGYRHIFTKQRCYSEKCLEQKYLCHLLPVEIQEDIIHRYFNKCTHCETYWSPKTKKCECCRRKLTLSKHIKQKEKVYY